MKQLVIYVHGKGGSEKEADHYRPLFVGSTVIGFDYQLTNALATRMGTKFR